MSEKKEMTHKTFNRLTVVGEAGYQIVGKNNRKKKTWWCKCNCGNPNLIEVTGEALRHGSIKSCGCLYWETRPKRTQNEYDLSGEYGIGYCTNGSVFYFDIEDYDKIKDYCWNNTGTYVQTHKTETKNLRLHRLIMEDYITKDKFLVDHVNGNKFDNRKSNLRVCSQRENSRNKLYPQSNTGVMGVNQYNNVYRASIQCNGKTIKFDCTTLEEAIDKRMELEKEYFGEFAPCLSRNIDYKDLISEK